MQERLARFVDRAKAAGVERLAEDGTSPDEYRQSLEQLMKVSVDGNVAFGRRVQLLTESSEKYPVGGSAALTNGLHGSNDYHCNWLGFEATSMEAVVDLDSAQSIHSVSTGFLQNWYAWIWLPLSVGYSVSLDGISYTSVATVPNQVADTANGAFNRQFESTFAPTRCRFLKVVATSRRTCPEWHIGAGQKAWIFADEIVVR